jgi:hypothetical protein
MRLRTASCVSGKKPKTTSHMYVWITLISSVTFRKRPKGTRRPTEPRGRGQSPPFARVAERCTLMLVESIATDSLCAAMSRTPDSLQRALPRDTICLSAERTVLFSVA